MNDKGKIALSSLAVSVSSAALLGISGVAKSDPPEPHCYFGSACGLGYNPHGYYIYTTITGWEGQEAPIVEGSAEGGDVYEDVGVCGYDTSSPEVCSCNGWVGGGFNFIQYWYWNGMGDPMDPHNYWAEWQLFTPYQYTEPVWTSAQLDPQCWNY